MAENTDIANFEVKKHLFMQNVDFFLNTTKYPICEIENNYIKLRTFSMYIAFLITSNA